MRQPSPVLATNEQPLSEAVFDYHETIPTSVFIGSIALPHEQINYSLKIPEGLAYDGLAIFIPGYMGIRQSSEAIQEALAQEGVATVIYGPARKSEESFMCCAKSPQNLHINTLEDIIADIKLNEFIIRRNVAEGSRLDFDKYLLIMHSMGGLSGPGLAKRMKSGVDRMVGLATTGFGHPTPKELLFDIPKGIGPAIKHELLPALVERKIEPTRSNLRDLHCYYKQIGRFMCEGISCLSSDITETTAALHDAGVPYDYVAFGRDILVRPDPAIAQYVSSWEIMKPYGHLAPQVKAPLVARLATEKALHGR